MKTCIHHVQYCKTNGGQSPDIVGGALSAMPSKRASLIKIFASSGSERNAKLDNIYVMIHLLPEGKRNYLIKSFAATVSVGVNKMPSLTIFMYDTFAPSEGWKKNLIKCFAATLSWKNIFLKNQYSKICTN